MNEWIDFFLRAFTGRNGFVLELFLCEALFLVPVKCRKYAALRIPFACIVYFSFGYFCPAIPLRVFTAIVICLMIFTVSVGLQFFCFDLPLKRIMFNCSAAYILQNITLNAKELFRIWFQWGGGIRLIFETIIVLTVFAAGYFLFARRSQRKEIAVHTWWIIVISFFAITVSNVFFSLLNFNGLGNSVYTKLIFIICGLLAMLFQFSVFYNEELSNEKVIIEQLLSNEQKQHRMSQENIDLINIKCHDLKNQIAMLRKGVANREMEEVFESVERAVMLYGDTIKTGNDNRDLILTEKQLYCKKHEIHLEVIADGAALNFMSPADVYSLFGNAVDNAIESVMKSEAEKRIVNIYVQRKGNLASATVANYCGEKVIFRDELPVTTKKDRRYHGFGVRSMKYVVEKYKGNIVFHAANRIFSVNIVIPIP